MLSLDFPVERHREDFLSYDHRLGALGFTSELDEAAVLLAAEDPLVGSIPMQPCSHWKWVRQLKWRWYPEHVQV